MNPAASPEMIEARYRSLAKIFHPDRNPGDVAAEERFKRITAANEILSNPQRRAEYDTFRRANRRQSAAPVKPTIRAGRGTPKAPRVPASVRMAIAVALLVAGVATAAWRLSSAPADAATEITLWLMAAKFFVVGLFVAALGPIRTIWEQVATGG